MPNKISFVSKESTKCEHSKNASMEDVIKFQISPESSLLDNLMNSVSNYLTKRGHPEKNLLFLSPQTSPKLKNQDNKILRRKPRRNNPEITKTVLNLRKKTRLAEAYSPKRINL